MFSTPAERILDGGGSLGGFPVSSAGVLGVPSMRRPLALLLVIAAAGAASFAQARPLAPAGPNATFVITGHGWGHGIGLSQYGALGKALRGMKAHSSISSRVMLHASAVFSPTVTPMLRVGASGVSG